MHLLFRLRYLCQYKKGPTEDNKTNTSALTRNLYHKSPFPLPSPSPIPQTILTLQKMHVSERIRTMASHPVGDNCAQLEHEQVMRRTKLDRNEVSASRSSFEETEGPVHGVNESGMRRGRMQPTRTSTAVAGSRRRRPVMCD